MQISTNQRLLTGFLQSYFGFEINAVVSNERRQQNAGTLNDKEDIGKRRKQGRKCLRSLAGNSFKHGMYQVNKIKFPHRSSSLSYSGTAVAAVFSPYRKIRGIGVDIELNRTMPEGAEKLLLSARETALMRHHSGLCGGELLRIWTVKEALLKSDPLNEKTGWLTAYELLKPYHRTGEAVLKKRKCGKQFRYISFKIGTGYLSFAVCL